MTKVTWMGKMRPQVGDKEANVISELPQEGEVMH